MCTGVHQIVYRAALGCVVLMSPFAANAADATPPSLVPSGAPPFAVTTATGVQMYSCEFDSAHRLGWVFQHPEATLYDGAGQASIQHGAGPSWQAGDGSYPIGATDGLAWAGSQSTQSTSLGTGWNCTNWTLTTGFGATGAFGYTIQQPPTWWWQGSGSVACTNAVNARLYCVEQ